jgi:hypothetical protein
MLRFYHRINPTKIENIGSQAHRDPHAGTQIITESLHVFNLLKGQGNEMIFKFFNEIFLHRALS